MLPITLPALAYMPLHVCVSVCKYVYANKFILLCQQPATLRTSLCPQRNSHTLSTLNLHRSYEYNGAYGAPQRRISAATAYLFTSLVLGRKMMILLKSLPLACNKQAFPYVIPMQALKIKAHHQGTFHTQFVAVYLCACACVCVCGFLHL